MNKTRSVMFIVTLFIVFALSAMNTAPVLADDGTPPPPEPTETADPPPVESDAEVLDAQSDPSDTDETPPLDLPVEESLTPAEVIVEETPTSPDTILPAVQEAEEGLTEPESPAELLSQVPEGTDVMVVNAGGEVVPLVSEEAAQIIDLNDPIWCPTGVAPNPGVGGCTTTQTSFNGGLLPLIANKTVSGTIWILGSYTGTDPLEGVAVTLDGSLLGTTANFALTIQGGWTGASTGTLVDTLNPSEFNVPLSIINWNADVTLNDLLITAVVDPASTALTVTTTKNITMNRVDVSGNQGSGAYLDNSGYATTTTVTVNSSQFNNNAGGSGLEVYSNGVIKLSAVIANGNGYTGATLYNYFAGATAGVTLAGSNTFNTNEYTGLMVYSNGAITLNNVTAGSSVSGAGAYLNNTSALAAAPANVTLTGINTFNGNVWGLTVLSDGVITLNSVTASNNGSYGAYLNNTSAAVLTPKNVTLTGTNVFNSNGENGLEVYSNGAIVANNLTASSNGQPLDPGNGWGAILDNAGASSAQIVTLTGFNTFDFNSGTGLGVFSKGVITAGNLQGNNTTNWFGVYLDNDAAATPQAVNVTGTNGFDNNNWTGLVVNSKGTITVNNVSAFYNGTNGVSLNNQIVGAVGGINLTGISEFANNGSTGITANSNGSIILANLDSYDNGINGVYLHNDVAGSTGGISIGTTLANWVNYFGDNGNNGIRAFSRGAITLLNVWANNNGYTGAYLANNTAASAMAVTITNSVFDYNGQVNDDLVAQLGLEVYSKGAITISNLDANNNGNGDLDVDDGGAWLDNTAGTAGVTLLGVNIVSSNEWGLGIFTNGAVVLNNLVNNNNSNGSGLYVDNCGWNGSACTSVTVAPISILGTSEFKFNVRGIHMTTNGAITLNNITANNNFGNCDQCGGIYLWNADSPTSASVTLTGINTFRENSMTGLQVYSKGVVLLNNITANDNGWYDSDNLSSTFDQYFGNGAYIDNTFAVTPKTVTLAGLSNTFMGNATTGLVILSKGSITAAAMNASMNGWVDSADADPTNSSHGDGAFLDNCLFSDNGTPLDDSDDYCSNPVPASFVKLTGTNTFNNNGWGDGLEISTLGVITVSNLTADNNGSQGAYLYNIERYWNASTSTYKHSYNGVTITGYANTGNNGFRGMSIYSAGVISVTNANASNNGGIGLRIYNAVDTAQPKAISLLGTNVFNGNWMDGLKITGYGAVTTNNVSARWNGHYDDVEDTYYGYGVLIDNCGWNGTNCNPLAPVSAVTMNGTNVFWSNNLSGLEVYSKGAIKVNQITSNYNGWVDWNNEDYWDHDSDINTPDIPNTDTVYGYGAFLYNRDGLAAVTITGLKGAYFESNWNTGLHIESRGAIAVDKLTSIWNGQENGLVNNEDPFDANDANGAYLDNMWPGAVGDVTITGYGRADGNLEYGLEIYSNGNIKLTTVSANDNGFKGVHAENDTAPSTTPKTVSILGTNNFNGNGAHGLVIKSYGVITLSNINAGWNGGMYNAYIDNCRYGTTGCTALAQAAVTMTGTNNFDGNWGGGGGLYLQSFGNITIANLSVNNNNGNGAYIDNQFFNEALIPVASLGAITITGYADFYNNGFDGLYAYSNGNITIANLSASNNGGDGSVGGAYLSAQKPGLGTANVVLTGYNNFNQNYGGSGLTVFADGAITIANLSANENWDGDGAYLDNRVSTTLPMAVTLTGFNNFWHNYLNGLTIFSYGAVAVSNIDASDNGVDEFWSNAAGPEFGWGLYIDNRNPVALSAKSVTLTGFNSFNSNWNSGLEIWSSNLVTLSNVTTNYNGNYYDDLYSFAGPNGTYVGCGDQTIDNGDNDFYVGCGAYIDNSSAAAPMNVVLLGVNEFLNTTHHGLEIISKGQILLSSITANGNGWYYYGLDTTPDTVFGSGAYLVSTMKGITFSGNNTFDNNWDDGLFAQALDLITVNNLGANGNGGIGAYLDNQWDVKHSDVVIKGYSYANNNGSDGIAIYTNGSATLANVIAGSNAGTGLYIAAYDNNPAPLGKPSNVTISGTNWFWGNGGDGLEVLADGLVTLNNINASHNGGNGATIDGISAGYWTPLPAVRLNITGSNNFNSNGNIGLFFNTFGNVTLTRVTADNNFGTGVVGTTTGNITYTCGSVTRNGSLGYDLTATGGTLTLTGVSSTGNSGNLTTASSVVRVRACPLP